MSEKTRSVRVSDELYEALKKRFGSLRGAIIAMYELQKLIDERTRGK